ncbi:MAG TPA: type IV secretory system conjugative DNA transfer family protein, partial [Gemmatimonadales bacterium]|nr:type IV secretory system conjugative DNA transfer family protein [Gemmatimonadales bacterium]
MNPTERDTRFWRFDPSPGDDPSERSRSPEMRPALPSLAPRTDWPFVIGLTAALVLGLAAGTQYVAWRLGFHPRLGPPLVLLSQATARSLRVTAVVALGGALVLALVASPRLPSALRSAALPLAVLAACVALASVGRIYAPHKIVLWYVARATLSLPGGAAFLTAFGLVIAVSVVAALSITAAWPAGVRTRPSHSHGSAHWGDGAALDRPRGLLLGRHGGRLLRTGAEGHVLTVAPTRAGKGVSAVIPNLLDYPGGVLVTDPKGENYAVTHEWRCSLGHPVYAFDPFGIFSDGKATSTNAAQVANATFNPLDLIKPGSSDAVDDARLLADMLVLPAAREGEQAFWNEEARALLTGLILYAASSGQPEIKTLAHVRLLLTQPPDAFATLLRDMLATKAFDGLVPRAAARLLQKADRE